MGFSQAGFTHRLLVERDKAACLTLTHNKSRKLKHVKDWIVRSEDVRQVDWSAFAGSLDLVAGGPPCQPFSVGGKAAGNDDERDMWPEAVRAVHETMPRAFVFENVRGLLRPAFAEYVRWIAACLSHPSLPRKKGEPHSAHLARLIKATRDAKYSVQIVPVNTANYGAPQKRHRVLFVGFNRELGSAPAFPAPTHSQDRLVWDKWVTGQYWNKHGLTAPSKRLVPSHEAKILARLLRADVEPAEKPWVTCRDVFSQLGEPGTRHDIANHAFQPGAKSYAGHTGSHIDEPAKALKAGVHGVPGGENMLLREDGSVRYFSIREAACLQGLPLEYEFPGSWSESMRQLGNAVPVQLSHFAGEWILQNVRQAVPANRRSA
jgi:DNA (cytosine-5)-methyltransferase 1